MGYPIIFNCLLTVTKADLDLETIEAGKRYSVEKAGERLYPLNIPIEICDEDHNYYGKIAVRRLTLETDKTVLEIEVLKIFNANEAAVYSSNFIKP